MVAISRTSGTQSTQDVTATTGASGSDFGVFFKAAVKAESTSQLNEEELFAGVLKKRIEKAKGSEVAAEYQTLLDAEVGNTQKPDGFIAYEDAAKAALKNLQSNGKLSDEEAAKVYSEAFDASQLDSNKQALYDGRGGKGDITVALAELAIALQSAEATCAEFDAGTKTPALRSLGESSNGKVVTPTTTASNPTAGTVPSGNSEENPVDGANGFLFKPISENQQTVAVLLPPSYANQVTEVLLKDENNEILDKGVSTGYGDTGEREKFSFPKPGSGYPKNITVEVVLADGSIKSFKIPDPSQRYD